MHYISEPELDCDFCGRSFGSYAMLELHYDEEHGPAMCWRCKRELGTHSQGLVTFVRITHIRLVSKVPIWIQGPTHRFENLGQRLKMGDGPQKWTMSLLEHGVGSSIIQDVGGTFDSIPDQLEFALRRLNLLLMNEYLVAYDDVFAWRLGGAETYVAAGQLVIQVKEDFSVRRFIAKAVITFPSRPEEAIEIWLRRIHLLSSLGVPCPQIYSTFKAVLYEEFIDYSLDRVWQEADDQKKLAWSLQLAKIAGVFDACGFQPIGFGQDLRVQGNTLYIVDVGADTGSYNFLHPVSNAYSQWRSSKYILPEYLPQLNNEYHTNFELARSLIIKGLDI